MYILCDCLSYWKRKSVHIVEKLVGGIETATPQVRNRIALCILTTQRVD